MGITGCNSYNPGGPYAGEYIRENLYVDKMGRNRQCAVTVLSGVSPRAISARCCMSVNDKKATLRNVDTTRDSTTMHERCNLWDNACDGEKTGCISRYGGSWSWGTKHVEDGSCYFGRADMGSLWAEGICIAAKTKKGDVKTMECINVDSDSAALNPSNGEYESLAQCPVGFEIVDCNAYTAQLDEQCIDKKKVFDLVESDTSLNCASPDNVVMSGSTYNNGELNGEWIFSGFQGKYNDPYYIKDNLFLYTYYSIHQGNDYHIGPKMGEWGIASKGDQSLFKGSNWHYGGRPTSDNVQVKACPTVSSRTSGGYYGANGECVGSGMDEKVRAQARCCRLEL